MFGKETVREKLETAIDYLQDIQKLCEDIKKNQKDEVIIENLEFAKSLCKRAVECLSVVSERILAQKVWESFGKHLEVEKMKKEMRKNGYKSIKMIGLFFLWFLVTPFLWIRQLGLLSLFLVTFWWVFYFLLLGKITGGEK